MKWGITTSNEVEEEMMHELEVIRETTSDLRGAVQVILQASKFVCAAGGEACEPRA